MGSHAGHPDARAHAADDVPPQASGMGLVWPLCRNPYAAGADFACSMAFCDSGV